MWVDATLLFPEIKSPQSRSVHVLFLVLLRAAASETHLKNAWNWSAVGACGFR